nr:hypothetical protein GCM10020093_049670 [Planobispora longispora]
MLVRLLNRVLRIIRLMLRLVATRLKRLTHVPAFGLAVMAAMLRYGHRHDSDEDFRLPLRRASSRRGGR